MSQRPADIWSPPRLGVLVITLVGKGHVLQHSCATGLLGSPAARQPTSHASISEVLRAQPWPGHRSEDIHAFVLHAPTEKAGTQARHTGKAEESRAEGGRWAAGGVWAELVTVL